MPKKRCKEAHLGLATTREILQEMQARGDVAMTVYPTSERGEDGSVLSAFASVSIKSCCDKTLDYRTVDSE